MAISTTVATTRTAVGAIPSSSSKNPKLSHFSSLQFPLEFRNFGIRNQRQKSMLRFVASAKQTRSYLDQVLESSDKPVLVDFYATWCGPCQFMVPILEQISTSMVDKLQVVKIETEKHPMISDMYGITALPTFILFKDGKPCDRFEGAMPAAQFVERIEAALKGNQENQ